VKFRHRSGFEEFPQENQYANHTRRKDDVEDEEVWAAKVKWVHEHIYPSAST
jgi:hypothetical protein